MTDSTEQVEEKLSISYQKYAGLWDHLASIYHCPIIQNNFEYPFYRLLGNRDAWDIHGMTNYVTRLNCMFYQYAQTHENFYICDINYLSASYGLDKWSDPFYYHMYKYAVAVPAIPYLSFNVANMIKSLYGKNKKAFNLDLDNTLWGGIIGDDGSENIEIGQETSLAQTYSEFQEYIKKHKQIGVLLTVNSKNNEDTAFEGLKRPDSVLRQDDFASFKANWNPKSRNLMETAKELNILPESFVFVDDNPAEREIIKRQFPEVSTPDIEEVDHYIRILDRSGFFEVTHFSSDDLFRNAMYQANAKRHQLELSFENYEDYLKSLEMKGEIGPFSPMYMSRIAQLTNKTNQFNLTTKRYNQTEIEEVTTDPGRITLYGKLTDKFGDNGIVSILIGRIDGKDKDELHMELWLMSCRVLKRDMEYAMMDTLVQKAQASGIRKIVGYYYPTTKNAMVKDFYGKQGFTKIREDAQGNTVWEFIINNDYQKKQNVIDISRSD
jgi:FkbH-like protein